MVDEALVAYRADEAPDLADGPARLRRLCPTRGGPCSLPASDRLVRHRPAASARPACGSGAFPMGILQSGPHPAPLDPDNVTGGVQHERATTEASEAFDIADQERRARPGDRRGHFQNLEDYGRKLYLIENCIYGVDIQPIAVQIAKLLFFIALVVDQRVDDARPIAASGPCRNLETLCGS